MSANTQLGSVEEACMKLRQLTDTETRDGFAACPEADGTLPTKWPGTGCCGHAGQPLGAA
jgi:hypothetical protein